MLHLRQNIQNKSGSTMSTIILPITAFVFQSPPLFQQCHLLTMYHALRFTETPHPASPVSSYIQETRLHSPSFHTPHHRYRLFRVSCRLCTTQLWDLRTFHCVQTFQADNDGELPRDKASTSCFVHFKMPPVRSSQEQVRNVFGRLEACRSTCAA